MSATPTDHFAHGFGWREAGDGPPVVFLHGLGGTRLAWEPQLQSLSDAFRCVAWDLPGYGASEALPALTFPAIAESIVELLDTIGAARAHVVGLSFGGQQAMHLALTAPERIDRLVLTDTSARFGADGTDVDEWKQLRLGPLDDGITPAEMAEAVIDSITAPGFAGRERDRVIEAFGHITSNALRAAVECLPTHDVSDRLSEITHETLVVVGELDTETPIAYAEFLAERIPNARLAVIPGAGHLAPTEAPDQFNRLVRQFLT